jgi:acetyl esterase/lipase
VLHGGFWLAEYDLGLGAPLAADLASRGYASFNLEYRRVGDGGGWPTTLQDVADGIDLLASLNVDTSHVVAIGHSAGGQLAAWAAGRSRLPVSAPGRNPKVAVTAVVSQAGVLDLTTAQHRRHQRYLFDRVRGGISLRHLGRRAAQEVGFGIAADAGYPWLGDGGRFKRRRHPRAK